MYYDKNLEILKSSSQMLYQQLKEEDTQYKVDIERISDKNYCIYRQSRGSHLHSVYNIEFEMDLLFKKLSGDESIVIIFGIGNGYALKYLKHHFPNVTRVIVVEPCLDLFKLFLIDNFIIDFIAGLTVSFLVNKSATTMGEEISSYIGNDNITIVQHIAYRVLFEDYYMELLKQVKEIVMLRMGNINFQRNASKLVMVNFINNIDYGCYNDDLLESVFKDKPLLVVAAGPSLNNNIHMIESVKDKAVVVAVGSAISILNAHGIKPHFRMAFDPTELEMKILKNLDNLDIPLIYSNTLYCEILKSYTGPKVRIKLSQDSGTAYFDDVLSIKENRIIMSAPSIAVSAVDMGVKLGSSKVVIIGFDGAIYEEKLYASGLNGEPIADDGAAFDKNQFILTKDIYNRDVYTNRGFLMNKQQMELLIKNNPSIEFINATEGGILTDYVKIKSLKAVIDEDFVDLDHPISIPKDFFDYDNESHKDRIRSFMNTFKKDNDIIVGLCRIRLKLLFELQELNYNKDKLNYVERELNYIESSHKEFLEMSIYRNLISVNLYAILQVIHNEYKNNGLSGHERSRIRIKKNIDFYSVILDYALFIDEVIIKKNELLG